MDKFTEINHRRIRSQKNPVYGVGWDTEERAEEQSWTVSSLGIHDIRRKQAGGHGEAASTYLLVRTFPHSVGRDFSH